MRTGLFFRRGPDQGPDPVQWVQRVSAYFGRGFFQHPAFTEAVVIGVPDPYIRARQPAADRDTRQVVTEDDWEAL